jgi:hypothetical protein
MKANENPFLKRLSYVLELAVLCDHKELHTAVVNYLSKEMEHADTDLLWFIALAEQFDVSLMKGAAYYALMMQGRDKWISLAEEGKLKHEHLWKLHSGYYLLVAQWEQCRLTQLKKCVHHQDSCSQKWQGFWKEATKNDRILNKSAADVLGRLGLMVLQLKNYGGVTSHQECRNNHMEMLNTFLIETKETLASVFVDISYVAG